MKHNKLYKVLTGISAGILAIGMLVGCGSTETAMNDTQIIMGTNAEFEPFEYREGTEVVGFDIEIAKVIAEKMGKELKIEDMEFTTALNQLGTGALDFVVAGLTVNEERSKQMDFSDTYFHTKQVVIVRADNTDITSKDDLKGKTVGVQLGTTGEQCVSADKEINCVPFDKGSLAVMDLASGKIDAVVIDEQPAKRMAEAQGGLKVLEVPFAEEEYAIAVQKGDTELLEIINETLREIKEDGTYDEIYAEFFGNVE